MTAETVKRNPGEGERRSPFAGVGPTVALAVVALLFSLAWRLGGDSWPGGRWPSIHLFTLGVLTPLIATFMTRFAAALLHARPVREGAAGIRAVLIPVAAGVVIAGRITLSTPLLAAGASLLAIAIGWLYVDLRTARRGALPSRFGFIVRAYERACSAFLHGALLGALLGAGVFPGSWYAPARAAHLQLMLLGWGGITLLATVVMFGPAVMRARIEEGSEARASRALPRAAIATTVAALALLTVGAGGSVAIAARVVASGALAVYVWTVVTIGAVVLRAARRASPSAPRSFMSGAVAWFVVASILNAVSVAAAKPLWMDAAAVVLLTGVFLHAILASLSHVLPLLAGRDARQRANVSRRLSAIPRTRAAVLSAGAALAAAGTGWDPGGGLVRGGWILVTASIVFTGALAAWAWIADRGTTASKRGTPERSAA